ncbi:MAG: PilZ domain-containing protein [Nitrospirae bacterium]|nr:PilZ domain-containing protein [Nitrospirota bacterium]MBI3804577.1 PilZ domain-containing protein [Candidatus Manganitrophaceae bacterium]
MSAGTAVFYERRKSIAPIDFTDRRRAERRSNLESPSSERRRLASQLRRFDREVIRIPVHLHVDGKEISGHTQNISLSGLLILISDPLPAGTPVTLQISFGESFCYLNISGQVVFCSAGKNNGTNHYISGIKFSAIHDFDQKILSTAIHALKQNTITEGKSSVSVTIAKDNMSQGILDFHYQTLKSLEEKVRPAIRKSTVHASKIVGWGSYLPPQEITAEEINKMFRAEGYKNVGAVVETLTGIKSRRYASADLFPSDLAGMAARDALNNAGMDAKDLDVIIYCGIAKDFDEPATAIVVQDKIGAKDAYAFDLVNACNGFVTGIDILDSMIASGRCENGMVVTGEKVSIAIDWEPKTKDDFKLCIFSYTIGDAGGAAVLTRATVNEPRGIRARWFSSNSEYWRLALAGTLEGANEHNKFFRSHGTDLETAAVKLAPKGLEKIMQILNWNMEDISLVIPHQIPTTFTDNLYHKAMGIPHDKLMWTFPYYGNIATASMPIAMCEAIRTKRVKQEDKVLLAGIAAGFSVGLIGLIS